MKTRWYYFNIQSINLEKELSLYSFNGYLMLSMTGKSNNHFFADLIIFGYANGTDVVKNISYYLIDSDDFSDSLNIITEMYSKIIFDNNIFGYTQEEKIKIVSIPEGVKLYKKTGSNEEDKEEILNDTIIDKNMRYSLYQNKTLLKTIMIFITNI